MAKKTVWFLSVIAIAMSSYANAWSPPVEFIVEEWARSGKLTKPVHLTYEGAALEAGKSQSTTFTQEFFLLPNGNMRTDIHVEGETFTLVRNRAQTVLLRGKNRIEASTAKSLQHLTLTFPADIKEMYGVFGKLELFDEKDFQFIQGGEGTRTDPAQSIALRERVSLSIYGNNQIGLSLPSRLPLLLDKKTLSPVSMTSSDGTVKYEVHTLQFVEAAERTFPETVSYLFESSFVSLRLKNVDTTTSMNPQWLDLGFILKSLGTKNVASISEGPQIFPHYLAAFF